MARNRSQGDVVGLDWAGVGLDLDGTAQELDTEQR